MVRPVTTVHENRVIAEPSQVLVAVADEATRRGYRVFDLGASLHGDVQEIVDLMTARVAIGNPGPNTFLCRRGR